MKKRINLLTIFAVSGLWHGASFAYIIWGLLNGVFQVIAELLSPARKTVAKLLSWKECFANRVLSTLGTFVLFNISVCFFRAGNMKTVQSLFYHLFHNKIHLSMLITRSIYTLGLERGYVNVLLFSIIVLSVVDYLKYIGKDVVELFFKQQWWFRMIIELFLVFMIIIFGKYGDIYDTASFIYFQF